MNIQRLRNLTTGRLHTSMQDIVEDMQYISGVNCLFTHELPSMLEAIRPWLVENVTEPRFWNLKYDKMHIGDYPLPEPSENDRKLIKKRFYERF